MVISNLFSLLLLENASIYWRRLITNSVCFHHALVEFNFKKMVFFVIFYKIHIGRDLRYMETEADSRKRNRMEA